MSVLENARSSQSEAMTSRPPSNKLSFLDFDEAGIVIGHFLATANVKRDDHQADTEAGNEKGEDGQTDLDHACLLSGRFWSEREQARSTSSITARSSARACNDSSSRKSVRATSALLSWRS
jgi:hypothetical protein